MGSALLSTVGRSNGAQGHWCWSLLPLAGVSFMALNFGLGVTLPLMGLLICMTCAGAGISLRRMRLRHHA